MSEKFRAHLFICNNIREGKACCGGDVSNALHAALKQRFASEAKAKLLRINKSGCLDQCEKGVAAVLYPSGRWFFNLTANDVDRLAMAVQEELKISP